MFGGQGGPDDSVVIDMTDEEVNETRTLRAMVHAQQDADLGIPAPAPELPQPAQPLQPPQPAQLPQPAQPPLPKPAKPAKTKPAKPKPTLFPSPPLRRSGRESHAPDRLNYDYYNR